jgi:hypothetical protein
MRIELQPFGFNGFMAGGANAVAHVRAAAEHLIDPAHFLVVPSGQAVEKPKPISISTMVHPLGILFDFVSFSLNMLESSFNAFPPLPKPIGTWDNL